MIVGVSGLANAGKDVLADRLVEHHGFCKVALADEIKRTAQRWYDFSDEQLWGSSDKRNEPDRRYPRGDRSNGFLTPRYVLQFLGSEAGRHFYDLTWVDLTIRIAKKLEQGGVYYDQRYGLRYCAEVRGVMWAKTSVVIPDVRFQNEMTAIREAGGKLVRVIRPKAGLSGAFGQHESETQQRDVPNEAFELVIHNDGTMDEYIAKLETIQWDKL